MSNMAGDAKVCFSSKAEYRAVIRFFYLKGKTDKEIHGEFMDLLYHLMLRLNFGKGNSNAVERV